MFKDFSCKVILNLFLEHFCMYRRYSLTKEARELVKKMEFFAGNRRKEIKSKYEGSPLESLKKAEMKIRKREGDLLEYLFSKEKQEKHLKEMTKLANEQVLLF